jgi:hypothetical protein
MEFDTKTRESALPQIKSCGIVCKHFWAMLERSSRLSEEQ